MSLFSGSNISELFVGESKIGSIFVGENCVYQSNYEIKPEPYLPNEYFYFKLNKKTDTARVGFDEVMTGQTTGSAAITYDKTKFINYSSPVFQYSFDKVTWNSYTLGSLITLDRNHTIIYFRGDNTKPWLDTYQTTYSETSNDNTYTCYESHWINVRALIQDALIKSGGNLLSLRNSTLSDITTIPCDYCFPGLFYKCENLLTPPVLSATTLKPHCYGGFKKMQTSSDTSFHSQSYGLFYLCKNLQYAPSLPATTLANYCYAKMFYGCSQLAACPELPATTLADYCYYFMFGNCSNILYAPKLSATILKPGCYANMFMACPQLIEAPALPSTTMAEGCYSGMFCSCKALTKAPELPATTLATYCYGSNGTLIGFNIFQDATYGMFQGCEALTTAPELPVTTLASFCYSRMFCNCKALTKAPELPATTLVDHCYYDMFAGSGITTAPVLSATTLKTGCYEGMFSNTKITKTPKLPATTVVSGCYGDWLGTGMFEGCQNLTSITTLPALEIGSTNAYYSMFKQSNVKASATQTTECKYAYRVPTSGTGSADSKSLTDMFTDASDTTKNFTPSVNTTFYINVPSF